MTLTATQTFITVFALALGAELTRLLPPILFPNGKKHPKLIDDLTPMIPPAVIGMLVVFSLKDINFMSQSHGIPKIVSVAAVVAVHLWKRNMIFTIIFGTALYMVLIRIM